MNCIMKIFIRHGLLFFLLIFLATPSFAQDFDARSTFENMVKAINNAKTLKYRFAQKERLRKGWNNALVDIKLNVSPLKTYIKCITPDEGVELLLVDGKYNGNVYVKPNGFPYINVKLSPTGSMLLGVSRHHRMEEAGYELFRDVISIYLNDPSINIDEVVTYKGIVNFDNKSCYHVELNDPNYRILDYVVQGSENVLTISRRLKTADYKILELNPNLSDYFDVSAGQTIKIPSSYSPKTVMYLDTQTHLPLYLEMSDENGLYEQYEFLNLVVNPKFAADEFDDTFHEYGF